MACSPPLTITKTEVRWFVVYATLQATVVYATLQATVVYATLQATESEGQWCLSATEGMTESEVQVQELLEGYRLALRDTEEMVVSLQPLHTNP
jgi:hypothetical protein